MKIKLHHVNLCSTNVSALDAFYRDVLDMKTEPGLEQNRTPGGGYAAEEPLYEPEGSLGVLRDPSRTVLRRGSEPAVPDFPRKPKLLMASA